ncbi:PQQ-binding-like beta-propeller repeat protein [Solihabitans fulvus]|uniref:PQQ-binding-like beta-propeller repeat protein n=1 Tax=Solihabitans fulvus TaxID=1892852 RepID=A0A5B2XLU0_9PSEU|nr:PQQ-binding-like beta-propeller repeat protein [Solihabitans fulvus]KAA2264085.1 PQQ-binding-like beta-propeller repeat protein [Solihabitans fulvus]
MGRPEQPENSEQLQDQGLQDEGRPGHEDVLAPPVPAEAGDVHPPQRQPRRWRTAADYTAAALIAIVALVVGLVIAQRSDARATVSRPDPASVAPLPPATEMPPSLAEVWRAKSGATPIPVIAGSTVVSADGGEVLGRDPLSGQVRWQYSRNLPLCTVGTVWGKVLALFHKATNCSEVTTLDADSGKRGPQRNGDAAMGTRLLSDGNQVTVTGPTYFESYRRDDLVKTEEFGTLRGLVNPGKQPRPGCTYGSQAISTGQIAVIERCPGELGDRVSVLRSAPDKSDEPQVTSTAVLSGKGARVVAVTATRVAVALPNPARLVLVDAQSGSVQSETPLDLPDADLAGDPAGWTVTAATTNSHVLWYTGSRTIALSATDLTPQWTVTDAQGPGMLFASRLLMPVHGGMAVLDQITGSRVGTIQLDRAGYQGVVRLGQAGPVVFEQRGDTLVALR